MLKTSRVMNALYAKAKAEREQALMALDLLENQAVGIGDHTVKDFMEDEEEALQMLVDAEDKIAIIENKFTLQVDTRLK